MTCQSRPTTYCIAGAIDKQGVVHDTPTTTANSCCFPGAPPSPQKLDGTGLPPHAFKSHYIAPPTPDKDLNSGNPGGPDTSPQGDIAVSGGCCGCSAKALRTTTIVLLVLTAVLVGAIVPAWYFTRGPGAGTDNGPVGAGAGTNSSGTSSPPPLTGYIITPVNTTTSNCTNFVPSCIDRCYSAHTTAGCTTACIMSCVCVNATQEGSTLALGPQVNCYVENGTLAPDLWALRTQVCTQRPAPSYCAHLQYACVLLTTQTLRTI